MEGRNYSSILSKEEIHIHRQHEKDRREEHTTNSNSGGFQTKAVYIQSPLLSHRGAKGPGIEAGLDAHVKDIK